jgi:autophagy-related protein 13
MTYTMDGSESSSTTGGFTTVGRATGAGFYSPPSEGNSNSEKTNRERINQIVQAFFWKATMVIIQSRMNVAPLLSVKTREKKTNKWVCLTSHAL